MAKTISERRLAIVLELTKDGAKPIEVTCRADYEISCPDCGQATQKSKVDIVLTPTQKSGIITLGQAILTQLT